MRDPCSAPSLLKKAQKSQLRRGLSMGGRDISLLQRRGAPAALRDWIPERVPARSLGCMSILYML